MPDEPFLRRQPSSLAEWLALAPQMRGLLSAIPREVGRPRSLSDADLVGLAQAYMRAIDRVVAAEINITARLLTGVAPERRRDWADRWRAELGPQASSTFEAMHTTAFASRIEGLLELPGDPNAGPRTVAFVDLRGSTAFMAEHDGDAIRALVDGMFLAAQEIVSTHDVFVAKHLGDGVMLVGTDPAEMYAAARTALRAIARATPLAAGVGIDCGSLTTRAGDFFGTPVNRASRLAEIAAPDEIVLSERAVPDPAPAGVWSDVPVRGLPQLARALTVRDV